MSEIKVNLVTPRSGTTVTLGEAGDTIALGTCAAQTGFGRTGTVDWVTGSIKTATFSAVSGNGYFCNTTAGIFTVNLPAGSAGDIVGISDYASTFNTNNLTVTPNGSELINGVNDDYTISTDGFAVSLVYVDGTKGWKSVTGSDADATGVSPAFVVATGGSPSTGTISGDYKYHAFTGDGPLCISTAGNPAGNDKIDYLVLAGGGGGGGTNADYGGAGGAGGYRESVPSPAAWTGSPIALAGGGVTASVADLTITVGGGGARGFPTAAPGTVSTFSTITSAGGGGGKTDASGADGGSGSGGSGTNTPGTSNAGGSGNVPATPVSQGFDGGAGNYGAQPPNGALGGGGGGSGAVGTDVANPSSCGSGGGPGGAGLTSCISGTAVQRGGGGGGGGNNYGSGIATGGAGGGGDGAPGATAAGVNSGGGGGGAGHPANPPSCSTDGGSGIVVVRYKFQ
jgi:hypothetical protein